MTRATIVAIAVGLLVAICGSAVCAEKGCGLKRACLKTPSCCKTCQETDFDEEERTFYRPVYKEEMVEKVVNTVEYVEETRYRCRPCTVWQPKPTGGCEPCEPVKGCGPAKPCEMVPVQILRKVPYTVVVKKCVQKTEKVPRTVCTMEPYTVIVCIPRAVCKPVPVPTCRPSK
ncbi:MAG: hypothetical protein HQ567_19000 [Candidatus Nealsonbacteria bacterium]|nr:hypothetical protein [Candidatus Nealsonbacteria bacterium]